MARTAIVKRSKAIELGSKYFLPLKNGLQFQGKPTYDEWAGFGKIVGQVDGAVHWWIGDWVNYGEKAYGEKYNEALEATAFAYQTLARDAAVAKTFEITRRRVNLSWAHHCEVAGLPVNQQDSLLERAEAEGWTRAELREAKRALLPPPTLPKGKYRVIHADPPWKYSDELIDGYGAAQHHYQAMTLDELVAMPVMDRAAPDAVLFLWVTSPMLRDCWGLIEAWGFEYKTSFVWDKVKHNYGHYNSVRHELLLVCTRGSCTPDTKTLYDSVQTIERTDRHSEKPEEFYQIIEKLYEHGKKMELFGRKKRRGWDVVGNEL